MNNFLYFQTTTAKPNPPRQPEPNPSEPPAIPAQINFDAAEPQQPSVTQPPPTPPAKGRPAFKRERVMLPTTASFFSKSKKTEV